MTARLTDLLAPDGRRALDGILAGSRTMLGAIQPIQVIVNRSIDLFDILIGGASRRRISAGSSPKEEFWPRTAVP